MILELKELGFEGVDTIFGIRKSLLSALLRFITVLMLLLCGNGYLKILKYQVSFNGFLSPVSWFWVTDLF